MKHLALALALLLLAAVVRAAGNERPNLVLIVADDLGYGSLGCYGSQQVRTPGIDRLAASGLRLTDFHSNGPMCSPTRAALMTGRYQQRCARVPDSDLSPVFQQQRRNNPKQRWAWGLALEETTVAEVLRTAGYRTGLVGKWHLGYDPKFHPLNQGFDEFRGFVGGAVDYHSHVATHGLKELDWWNGTRIANEEGYTTDLLTKHATEFIARHRGGPFFLYLAHAAPHAPLQVRDPSGKPKPGVAYREMITALDESVDAIVGALEQNGVRDKTMLVFCSDNGPEISFPQWPTAGPLAGKKGDLLEGGHRVPCIVSWPGQLPRGKVLDAPVMTMDLFPTFAALAKATLPVDRPLDGIDLLPLLKGREAGPPRVLHWEFGGHWAVRRGDWKLTDGTKLVNLKQDPGERQNIAAKHPGVVRELAGLHADWIRQMRPIAGH